MTIQQKNVIEQELLVESIPCGDFNWLSVWEGDLLCRTGYDSDGEEIWEEETVTISLCREGDRKGMEVSNMCEVPDEVADLIKSRFDFDLNCGCGWDSDGENQVGFYTEG